jgi:hypothetical protein
MWYFRLKVSSMWIGVGCAPSVNMPSHVHETEENFVVFIRQRAGLQAISLCVVVKEIVITIFVTGIIALKASPNNYFIIYYFIMTKIHTHEPLM